MTPYHFSPLTIVYVLFWLSLFPQIETRSNNKNHKDTGSDTNTNIYSNSIISYECEMGRDHIISTDGSYILVNCPFSWLEGDTYCMNEFGTSLATILNEEEDEIVSDLCRQNTIFKDACWFGAYNIESDTNFEFADGTNININNYTNWITSLGFPFGGSSCGAIYQSDGENFGWVDSECKYFEYYEKKLAIICNLGSGDTHAPSEEPTEEPTEEVYDPESCENGINKCDSKSCFGLNENKYCMDGAQFDWGCAKCKAGFWKLSNEHPCVSCKNSIFGCNQCEDFTGCKKGACNNGLIDLWDRVCGFRKCY